MPPVTRKILIVEDDSSTSAYLAKGLSEAGFAVESCSDGRDGLFLASEGIFDLIIADRMLPGLNGIAMLGAIRAAGVRTPTLILSALGTVDDRIDGLNAGADDYLVKPFSFAELTARIDAIFRRVDRGAGEGQATRLSVGDLEIDLLGRTVARAGRPIQLGAREFNLLEYLARHAGQVVTRTMMLEKIWNYHFDPGSNVVDVHIGRLRRKLEEGFGSRSSHSHFPVVPPVGNRAYCAAGNSAGAHLQCRTGGVRLEACPRPGDRRVAPRYCRGIGGAGGDLSRRRPPRAGADDRRGARKWRSFAHRRGDRC
jgi:two-component system OmpR family response regulator